MAERIEVDTKTFIRFWAVILGLALIAFFVWRALTGLIIVGISIFLAIAIRPLVKRIDLIDRKKKRPLLSTTVAFSAVVLVIGFMLAVIGPVVISETTNFLNQAPTLMEKAFGSWDGVDNFGRSFGISNLKDQVRTGLESFSHNFVGNFGTAVVNSVGMAANLVTGTILVLVLTFLFLIQGQAILDKLWKLVSKQGDATVDLTKRIIYKMADVVSKYVSGQVTVAFLDGVITAVVVFILSLIFNFSAGLAFPLGLINMIFYMIPMFGAVIGCIVVSLLLFFSSLNIWAGISFLIFYIIYQQIENNIIAPKIQSDALKLSPLIILVSITIGIYMLGLIGAIIAIPIAGCIKVLLEEYPNIRKLRA